MQLVSNNKITHTSWIDFIVIKEKKGIICWRVEINKKKRVWYNKSNKWSLYNNCVEWCIQKKGCNNVLRKTFTHYNDT